MCEREGLSDIDNRQLYEWKQQRKDMIRLILVGYLWIQVLRNVAFPLQHGPAPHKSTGAHPLSTSGFKVTLHPNNKGHERQWRKRKKKKKSRGQGVISSRVTLTHWVGTRTSMQEVNFFKPVNVSSIISLHRFGQIEKQSRK